MKALLDLFCMREYIFGIFLVWWKINKEEGAYKIKILIILSHSDHLTVYQLVCPNQNFKRQRKQGLGCVREITVWSPRLKMTCWSSWPFFGCPKRIHRDCVSHLLTWWQFAICFFNPSTVFLTTHRQIGQVTRPLSRISKYHCSSKLPARAQDGDDSTF